MCINYIRAITNSYFVLAANWEESLKGEGAAPLFALLHWALNANWDPRNVCVLKSCLAVPRGCIGWGGSRSFL